MLGSIFLLTGCKTVQPNETSYTPISETTIASSYAFHQTSSVVTSSMNYGSYLVEPKKQEGRQKIYKIAEDLSTSVLTELEAGYTYVEGPLSPDCTKLFLYRNKDNEDASSYYGVIVDLTTGDQIVSQYPYFALNAVNWAGNDKIFLSYCQIRFYSTADFSEIDFRPDFLDTVEQDPDGKYIITGMIHDRNKDRYVLTYAEKKVGSTDPSSDYKMSVGIVLIDGEGRTVRAFTPGTNYYSPYSSTDIAARQTLQIDSSGNVSLFVGVMGSESDIPYTKALIVNVDRAEVVKMPNELRDVFLRGGWVYGLTFSPYQEWWDTMQLNIYKPNDSYKYSKSVELYTEPNTYRYMNTTGTRSNLSYQIYLYPDGNVLLRSYHTEDGNTKVLLSKIMLADKTVTPIGVLPGNDNDMFKIAGIDNSGNIIVLGSKTA